MEPGSSNRENAPNAIPNFAGPSRGIGDTGSMQPCQRAGCQIMHKNVTHLEKLLATAQTHVEAVHARNEAVVQQCNNYALQINTLIAQAGNLAMQNNVLAGILKTNLPHHAFSGIQFRDGETQSGTETKTASTMCQVAQQDVGVQCFLNTANAGIQCDLPMRAATMVHASTQHYGIAVTESQGFSSARPDGSEAEMEVEEDVCFKSSVNCTSETEILLSICESENLCVGDDLGIGEISIVTAATLHELSDSTSTNIVDAMGFSCDGAGLFDSLDGTNADISSDLCEEKEFNESNVAFVQSLGSGSDEEEDVDSANRTTETDSDVANQEREVISAPENAEAVAGSQEGEEIGNMDEQENRQINTVDQEDGGGFDLSTHPILERNIREDIQERVVQAVAQHGIILDVDVEAAKGSYFSRQSSLNWSMRELVALYGRPKIPLRKLSSPLKGRKNCKKRKLSVFS